MGSNTSYDSASSYANNGYGVPNAYLGTYQLAYGHLPPTYPASDSRHSYPPGIELARPSSSESRGTPSRTSPTTHVRTHAHAGYVLRPPSMSSVNTSPLARKSGASASMTTGEDDDEELESEEDQLTDLRAPRRRRVDLASVAASMDARQRYQEMSHERHVGGQPVEENEEVEMNIKREDDDMDGGDFAEEQPAATPLQAPVQLGVLFSLPEQPSAPASVAAVAAATTPSPGGSMLQPGFTFVPPAPKDKELTVDVEAGKRNASVVEGGRDGLVGLGFRTEDDPLSGLFSSPLPQSHQRTRPAGTGPPASRSAGGAASTTTDLLSRVMESKAIKRGHGHQSSSSGSSASSRLIFPRPSTPTRDARPSTPPPRPVGHYSSEDEEARLLRNMDPSVAAAVTALTSLSPMRTPVSHAAFHMSPAPPPSSDLTIYKHSLGPPASPFRTPGRTTSSGGGRPFDYYDFLSDGPTSAASLAEDLDKTFGGSSSGGRLMGSGLLGPGGVPRTPATPITGGLFGSSSLYQSPNLPSPGWRRY